MGEDPSKRAAEAAALQAGIELGMTLVDTAEMYGDGATEEFLGEAPSGLRDRVFLVSKVLPSNAGRGRIARACEATGVSRSSLYVIDDRTALRIPILAPG